MKWLESVLRDFGTPVYVYFEEEIIERAKTVLKIFEGVNILPTFALKANNNPRLLAVLRDQGFGADVVTPGELLGALKAGVDPRNVVWNGNGKTPSQKSFFLDRGVSKINVDSIEEFERLWRDEDLELFLRINPGIDSKTHEHISTGMEEHKFGVHVEKAREFLRRNRERFVGLHVHVGSQITDVEVFERTYESVVGLSREFGFHMVNIGGGWGIDYGDGKSLDLERYSEVVRDLLGDFELVILEIGRFIMAPAGVLLAEVVHVKRGREKDFVVLNTGMSHLIRPPLYNAKHRITFLETGNERSRFDVVGYLCETGDFLLKNVEGHLPKTGSLALIHDVGAYGYSMSSNYNSIPRPPEVLVRGDGNVDLIRKGESLEDLYRSVV